jgi:ribosomal protein L40E
MRGPLHVIRRRRAERPANGVETAQAATEAPTQAHPSAGPASAPPPAAADQPPATPGLAPGPSPAGTDERQPTAEVPAGQEPARVRPSFRDRGRLRRRLRYLRRIRELGFRDLGGLVFDQHRFSQVNEALVQGKLAALAAVDGELRALEHALDDRRSLTELREPGVSVCSRCGALHGSEARFCPSCGTPVSGPRAIAEVGEAVSLPVGKTAAAAPGTGAPSSAPGAPAPPAQPPTPAPLALQARTPVREPAPPAPEPEPAPAEKAEPVASEPPGAPASDGEQPTEVARPVDGQAARSAADGEAEAVAQRTAERSER